MLSDVMSHSGLTNFAVVALVILVVAFVAMVIGLFWPGRRNDFERDAHLPLEDESPRTPRHGGTA